MFSGYLFSFTIALMLSLLLTPFVRILSNKVGATDKPSERKIHTKLIPRLGGLSIYLSFVITILISFDFIGDHVRGLLLGSTVIVICGVIDDIKELNYKVKLIFQLAAAIILVSHNISIERLSIFSTDGGSFINLGILSVPITILWIIGITNAINLIDGLDGLACGLSSISSIFLFIIFMFIGNHSMALMVIILAGASLGFLPYNFNPASIFMGDTGSMFLGFILAGMSIQGTVKYATTIIIIIPILVLGLPIYDTFITMLRRFIQGNSITSPDKQHFHHRMLKMGLSQKQVALLSYGLNILLGILALILLFYEGFNRLIVTIIITSLIALIIFENYYYSKIK